MKAMIPKLLTKYDALVTRLAWPQSVLLLLIRLAWGFAFFQAGWGKLGNLEGVTEFFTGLGIPAPAFHAVLVSIVETAGGLLLALGLFSRLVAIPLGVSMVVAYLTAHTDELRTLFTEHWTEFLEAAPGPYLLACLLVLLFGPGRLSLDAMMKARQ